MKLVQTAKIPFITLLAACLLAGCGSQSNSNSADLNNVKKVDPLSSDSDTDTASAEGTPGGAGGAHHGSINLRRNFYFVFDGSGSMKDPPPSSEQGDTSFKSKIEGAKWAVNEFMKNVPKNVNLGLFVFDAKGEREVLPLGPNNRTEFLSDINAVQAKGATPLGDAVEQGCHCARERIQTANGLWRIQTYCNNRWRSDRLYQLRNCQSHEVQHSNLHNWIWHRSPPFSAQSLYLLSICRFRQTGRNCARTGSGRNLMFSTHHHSRKNSYLET